MSVHHAVRRVVLCAVVLVAGCGDDAADPMDAGTPRCRPADAQCPAPIDASCAPPSVGDAGPMTPPDPTMRNGMEMITEGREIFRHDTFGSEAFWGGRLGLHRTIAGAENGGEGPGLSPRAALMLGLKVDSSAIPADVAAAVAAGMVDLDDPANTVLLLRANAVVGVTGRFASDGTLESVGIQCALCHSTVDDSFMPGVGLRRDGWPNRDLNVGEIIAFAPDLQVLADLLGVDQATVRTVLRSWGPGKFDAELILDGRAMRPDGRPAATLIPAAFGLAGVNLHTYTGWGGVSHWNAFVSNLEMHGSGTFFDPRLDDATQFPIAARERFGHVTVPEAEDRITAMLPALQIYQLTLPVPQPPAGSFDATAAARGSALFGGRARCSSCHTRPLFTEPGWNMHTPEEIGIDDFQASRSPDRRYRTTPLRGLFTRTTGGFYHDGRFATLDDVVAHYDAHFELGLSPTERADLVEYLKSL